MVYNSVYVLRIVYTVYSMLYSNMTNAMIMYNGTINKSNIVSIIHISYIIVSITDINQIRHNIPIISSVCCKTGEITSTGISGAF